MKSLCKIALAVALACPAALLASPGGPGHEHDEAKAAPAGQAAPRFESHSELFELVGILDSGRLTLYLDRYRDNAPVVDAKLEVEGDAFKGEATPQAGGTYTLPVGRFASPGRHALTFTVTAGDEVDLLSGVLEVASPGAARSAPAETHRSWQYWPFALGIGVLALAMFFAGRLHRGARGK